MEDYTIFVNIKKIHFLRKGGMRGRTYIQVCDAAKSKGEKKKTFSQALNYLLGTNSLKNLIEY